jgi:hypothetical protein
MQLLNHRPALRACLVGVGHKPGESVVDSGVETGITALIEGGAISRGFVDIDL